MQLDKEWCSKLDDDVKLIFDEVAIELADALRNVRKMERGLTREESKKLAFYTAGMIRRAGKMCATCGIQAQSFLESADSN